MHPAFSRFTRFPEERRKNGTSVMPRMFCRRGNGCVCCGPQKGRTAERSAREAKNVSRETISGCSALKMFHVKHYDRVSRFFCSSQTLSMAMSAGDTPAMRLA